MRRALGGGTALVAAALVATGVAAAQEAKGGWTPPPPMPDAFDWIQLKSDEWLKGRIVAMYRRSLEFDSEELEDRKFDFADVRQIRSAATLQVRLLGGAVARGKLLVDGERVLVVRGEPLELKRSQVVSIARGDLEERDYWSAKVGGGANARSGNSKQLEANARVEVKRRTAKNRVELDYLGNYSSAEDLVVANNQRAKAGWDRFVSDRFFLRPLQLEYFRDPFQNVAHRYTVGGGVGYQLVDTPKVDWQVSVGLGYQQSRFDDVTESDSGQVSTPALTVASEYEHDLGESVDFTASYKLFVVNEASGRYTHSLLTGLSFSLMGSLDLDVTFAWDRIEKPRPAADGTVPKKDDLRLNLGLSLDF